VAYFAGNLLSAVVWSVQCLEIVEAEVSLKFSFCWKEWLAVFTSLFT